MFDRHWHEHLQFMRVTGGEALLYCDSGPLALSAGDIVVINPGELHHFERTGKGIDFEVIRIDLALLQSPFADSCQAKYLEPLARNRIVFDNRLTGDAGVEARISDLLDEYAEREPGFELAVKAAAFDLLVALLRRHVSRILSEREYERQSRTLVRFRSVFDHIETHLDGDLSPALLSDIACLSLNHFCRTFRRVTGQSSGEYVTRARLRRACDLLSSGELSVTEVAYACGFNDSGYFSRVFRKAEGVSPSEYSRGRGAGPVG